MRNLKAGIVRIAAVFVLIQSIFVSTASAEADSPSCGEVVMHSVTLRQDLICPHDTGSILVIGSDDITIDLGGHEIQGGGSKLAIDGRGGFDRVTIRNGTVRDVSQGIDLDSVSEGAIRNVTVGPGVLGAIGVSNSDHMTISGNSACAHFLAISLVNVSDATLSDNFACDAEGAGISLNRADRAFVYHNEARGNRRGGVRVADSDDVSVLRNRLTDNGLAGVLIGSGARALVGGNHVRDNGSAGIVIGASAVDSVVRNNKASFNGYRPSLAFHDIDGIRVEASSTVVAENIANHNAGYGIAAPNGAVDGGRNHAHRNGASGQCLNIAC